MHQRTFLAATASGLARAECQAGGSWTVEAMLTSHKVYCLASVPGHPHIIYAGTDDGVLCSTDGGRNWQAAGMRGHIVKSLAASRHAPGLLYAGTKPACIFVSPDSGKSWRELDAFRKIRWRWLWRSPADMSDLRAYVQALATSPTDPDVIVAGIEFGAVVRSTDGGKSWSNHRKGALRDCHSLTFHVHNGNWVYEAGGTGVGAAVSRDGGDTWRQPKAGLDRHYGWACAADPARPEVWYVSASSMFARGSLAPAAHVDGRANACIFRSSGGAAWEKLAGGLPQPLDYMAYDLLTDPVAPGHLYAGLSNGDIWHSTDYGEGWNMLPFNLGAINRMLLLW
jgi:hypothetical protein